MYSLSTPEAAPKTILVVDDYAPICDIAARVLRPYGYRVLTAADGAAALRIARATSRIDLLLTDLHLPRMRGDDLAVRFSRIHPDAAITLCSGFFGGVNLPEPYEMLLKPYTADALLRTVQSALRSHLEFVKIPVA